MLIPILPNLYRITVELPNNPLRSLNSYVITGDRNLIIDTGFNLPECLRDLTAGIAELGLDMGKTDIFLTHMHGDHSGLASQIMTPDSTVYMSGVDRELFSASMESPVEFWDSLERRLIVEGYPLDEMEITTRRNPAKIFVSSSNFQITPVEDKQELTSYSMKLRCVFTPGHTPGHMCLYSEENQIMFTGDHILFDITPNITSWPSLPNSLASYMRSLEAVRKYPVRMTLTGHRENEGGFKERIDQLLEHHRDRLSEVCVILSERPLNGYEVASRMKWSIRVKSWSEFPAGQKWFAVGEALAHLNYLVGSGTVNRVDQGGVFLYSLA